jgi:sec-independent protein translocase protein TatC
VNKASFIDHLEELRKRILYSIAVAGILSIIGFVVAKPVLGFIIQRVNIGVAYFFTPTEAFTAQIKVALFLGILAAFPFIIVQTWLFVGPGLTEKEQRMSLGYVVSGVLLFLIGITFAYFILIPFGLKFLLSFGTENLKPIMNISGVLSFVLWCLLGCGIMFQIPLLIFTLIKLGIVQLSTVAKHQAEAIVAIMIICAIVTPTGDMFTLAVISAPLILLFEVSLLAARISLRARRKT